MTNQVNVSKHTMATAIAHLTNKGVFITVDNGKKFKGIMYASEKQGEVKIESKDERIPPMKIVVNNAKNLGNKSWGRIDFLSNYHGFVLMGIATYKVRMKYNK